VWCLSTHNKRFLVVWAALASSSIEIESDSTARLPVLCAMDGQTLYQTPKLERIPKKKSFLGFFPQTMDDTYTHTLFLSLFLSLSLSFFLFFGSTIQKTHTSDPQVCWLAYRSLVGPHAREDDEEEDDGFVVVVVCFECRQ